MEGDEETALIAPSLIGPKTKANSKGIIFNRLFILFVLVLLASFGLYSESQISNISLTLETINQRLANLEAITTSHEVVIQRFNASVTNTDVLQRLDALQADLEKTVDSLHKELKQTRQEIRTSLDDTVYTLNATVTLAEQTIHDQVEKVKRDVDQYVITTQDQFSMENSFMVYQLAGTFTLLSCLISMWHMTAHLRKLHQPDVQRKILAILWMSPIYAITSWFSLVFHSAEGYLAIIKDAYEAYVIYQFLSFLIAVLGKGDRNTVVDLLAKRADHLTPPFRFCACWEICGCCPKRQRHETNKQLANEILLQCQVFAMQFVFFRPLTTTAMVVLQKLNYYGNADSPMDYRAPQFYIVIVQNLSIFIAFTGLLKFYHAVDTDLAWCRPFAKFMCIKGVVFMTFWQGLAISVLAQTTDVGGVDADEWAKSAQNFLICLEMLLFSIAHFYCFPTEEWQEGYRVKHSQGKFGDSIALGDFFADIKLILKANSARSSTNYKKKSKKSLSSQPQHPPTIFEGSSGSGEEDEDEISVATASTTTSTTTPLNSNGITAEDSLDEKLVARALEESLGLAADDPDIAEAKQRLLASKVLSPKFFDYSESSREDEELVKDDPVIMEARHHFLTADQLGEDGGNRSENLAETQIEETAMTEDEEDGNDEGEIVNEQTSLLFHSPEQGSTFAEVLRPSIFTTVASVAEMERQAEERSSKRKKKR